MANTTAPDRIAGLAALAPLYPAILCDVWGVVHNGERSYPAARTALSRYRAAGGIVVLVTNSPRRSPFVVEQMGWLGVEEDCYDAIVTSGDVTRDLLAARAPASLLHIGPARDLTLYEGLGLDVAAEAEADLICCTGLREDERESPLDYDDELHRLLARGLPMICANPDVVVERGERRIWCAGALAERYAGLGGETLVAGKPHPPIYAAALARMEAIRGRPLAPSEVLAIGDGAPTDVRGAFDQGLDVLFVSGGIHAANFGATADPDAGAVHRFLAGERLGARAFVPHLAW